MFLRDPPEAYYCGYQSAMTSDGTVTYDSLLYSRSNQPTGGLSINTGKFTAPYPGSYEVNWSVRGRDTDNDGSSRIHLHKNGEVIPESYHKPVQIVKTPGTVYAHDSKTLILHLDLGDSIYLHHV